MRTRERWQAVFDGTAGGERPTCDFLIGQAAPREVPVTWCSAGGASERQAAAWLLLVVSTGASARRLSETLARLTDHV